MGDRIDELQTDMREFRADLQKTREQMIDFIASTNACLRAMKANSAGHTKILVALITAGSAVVVGVLGIIF